MSKHLYLDADFCKSMGAFYGSIVSCNSFIIRHNKSVILRQRLSQENTIFNPMFNL